MKITALETIVLADIPHVVWVRVHTDAGLVGLGESFRSPYATAEYVHETASQVLLGRDPRDTRRHWRALTGRHGYTGNGVEVRAKSALDIALWDILGQAAGLPLYRLLGGQTLDKVPVYNTCAGADYLQRIKGPAGVFDHTMFERSDRSSDLWKFVNAPEELAHSLLEQGITAMKIWPFDRFAPANGTNHISPADLRAGLEPFERIRRAVGDRMEMMCELSNRWDLQAATRIGLALESLGLVWIEDPILPDSLENWALLADRLQTPVCGSEILGDPSRFAQAFRLNAVDIAMIDIAWCGGITGAQQIAAMAAINGLPVTPHDCTGPIAFTAGVHLSVASPNTIFQEFVRAFYSGWFREVVTELPAVSGGAVVPTPGAGLGTRLQDAVFTRADAQVRRSTL